MMLIIAAYLMGSIPFGLLFVELFLNQDLKKIGSGNIGTTNVLRTGNKWLTLLTLLCDGGKGGLMVWVTQLYAPTFVPWVMGAVVLGHNFPVFLGFRGGKGFATTFGLILYFNPLLFLVLGAIWLLAVLFSTYSSFGAITILVFQPILFRLLTDLPNNILSGFVFLSLLGLFRHRENIFRLLKGQENPTDLSKLFRK